MRVAYSYIRFSTPEQSRGDSKRRQLERSEQFALEHGLLLDKSLRLFDEGVSAYKGAHRQAGALGRFLKAVEQGDVASGSVLIVESLDRLTREDVDTAFQLFMGILRSGIDVVSLIDRRWYTREEMKRDPTSLITSIVSMWRANEESNVKADRQSRLWTQKRKEAAEQRVPLSSRCPGWVRPTKDGRGFEAWPERAKKVRLIFWLTLRGWSRHRIAQLLNQHRVPTWGDRAGKRSPNGWHASYITKMLRSRAVLGEFVPHSGRGPARKQMGPPIVGYYPVVVRKAVFTRAQARRPGPRGRGGPKVNNLFRGIVFDGEHPKHGMQFKDAKGDNRRCYLRSDYARLAPQEEPSLIWKYEPFEAMMLTYLSDLDWSSLTAGRNQELRQLAASKEELGVRLAEANKQMKRMLEIARLSGDMADVVADLKALAGERDALAESLKRVESQVAIKREFGVREMQAQLKSMAGQGDDAARLKLRDAVRRLVEAIYIYRKVPKAVAAGLRPVGGPLRATARAASLEAHLKGRCVRIVFRNGAERWLLPRGDADYSVLRFDGAVPPDKSSLTVVNDELGGRQVTDQRLERKLAPVKRDQA